MRPRLLAPALLLVSGCGGGTPEAEDADTVVLTAPTTSSGDRQPRRPRPTARAYGAIGVSETFPKGLDWVSEPPPDRRREPYDGAGPAMAGEGAELAEKLAQAVLATDSALVADGPTIVMRVAESSQIAFAVNLEPAHCYAVYAVGGDSVVELDAQIAIDPTASPPGLSGIGALTVAQDSDTGAVATIGFGGNCFKASLPIPIPAVLHVIPTSGSGLVAVQLFQGRAATPP